MSEKHITAMALFAVLAVGFVGLVGLTRADSGMTVVNTGNQASRLCYCEIEQYDFYGNDIGSQIQTIRVKSAAQHTDEGCQNRCDIQFGRSKRGRKKVIGWAHPLSQR